MKKKIALILSLLMIMLTFGACGANPKDVDYNGKSYDDLLKENVSYAHQMESLCGAIANLQMDISNLTRENKKYIIEQGGVEENILNAAIRWNETKTEYGECSIINEDLIKGAEGAKIDSVIETVKDEDFSVTKSGKTLTTDLKVKFGKQEVIFQLVYNTVDMEVSSVTINPIETLGAKLRKAGMNTLLSMGVVFFVLVFILLLISCFKIFPYLEEKKKNKEAVAEVKPVTEPVAPVVEEVQDDSELIAVIAAAIAASEGTSTDGFVVRSIRRR